MTFTSNLNAAQAETQQNNIMNSFIQYYIDNEINKLKQILVDAAPENLDNLHELGQAIQAETERALAAEGLLDQHIEDEEAARVAAVAALQTALDALGVVDTDLASRITAIEDAPYATDAGVTIVANDLRTDFESDDAALSGRLDTLEADPTTKTYVDTQDALALPKAGGNISVGSDVNFRYSDKLIIDSATELNLWSDGDIKIVPDEDNDILLTTTATGTTKVSNGLEVTGTMTVNGDYVGTGSFTCGNLVVPNIGSFSSPVLPDNVSFANLMEAIGDAILDRPTSADPAVTGTLTVDTNASLKFDSNLTKVENVLRGTGINIGNNIEMNPAAAGGRVEINGDLILDASDLTNAANDTAAAAAGVIVGQVYHDNGALRVRLS
jgi:hypothetical protein